LIFVLKKVLTNYELVMLRYFPTEHPEYITGITSGVNRRTISLLIYKKF